MKTIEDKTINALKRKLKKINSLYEVQNNKNYNNLLTLKIPKSQEVLSYEINEVLRNIFKGYKISVVSYSLLSITNFISYEITK